MTVFISVFFYVFLCFAFVQDKFKKVKVKKETTSSAAIYKFEAKRKRWQEEGKKISVGRWYLKIMNFSNPMGLHSRGKG